MAESRQRSRFMRYLAIGVLVLVGLYAVVGFLVLPWWLERELPDQLEQRMGWQAQVENIRVNPFTLSIESVGLAARDSDEEPVLGFDRIFLNLNLFQLLRGVVGFEAIHLQEPFVRLDLLDNYSINFARDWQNHNPASSEPEPEGSQENAGSEGPRLYFQQVTIEGGELLFRDFSQPEPAEFRVTPLDLTLNDFATWPREDRDSDYALLAAIGSQTIQWQGDLRVAPVSSTGFLSVSQVSYQTLEHFLAPYLPYDLRGGQVSVRTDYQLQAGEVFQLTTANGKLTMANLALATDKQSDEAQLTTASVGVDGVGFDLNAREAAVGQVTMNNLDLAVARNESGTLNWLAPLNVPGTSASGSGESSKDSEDPSSARPFRWSVEGIELANGRVHWQDRQPETTANLTLEQLALSVGTLSDRLEEPVTYQARAALGSGGRLSVNGQVTPAPFTLEAAISGSDVALVGFEPYLQEGANLAIAGGKLGLDGNLDLDGQQVPLTGTFSGTAEVADLALRLPGANQPLVSWQTLQLAPIEYNVNPARLEIGTVTLAQPKVNVVRGADSQHNVARVVATAGSDQAEESPATGDGEPGFIFRIDQLMLEQGVVNYTDRTLDPTFTTTLDELNGAITGLSNVPPQQGKVSIRGRVNSVAKVEVEGTLGTLGTEEVSDLKLTLEDLSLPVLSPYFGRYLGYTVDSGKLKLNLDYELAGTRLDAQNEVIMDRLELGQSVASDSAVNAPVKLGLALLRDSDGVIEVNLPISGDLSDPEFNISKVVMGAFVNLLAKAATSPFSMLGSIADMAGLTGEELGKVSFLPGRMELAEGEAQKLSALSDAMRERPELLLNIRGGTAPEADGLALLRQEMTDGGATELSDEEWASAREAYLAGNRELPPEALSNLAAARGKALSRMLQDTHGVSSDQLFLLDPSRDAEVSDQGEVIVRFTLDVR